MTLESRLLLTATSIAPAPQLQAQAERIAAACREGINWEVFLPLVARHWVLVPYDALRRVLGAQFPNRVYEQLKAQKSGACKLARRHTAELVGLNQAFRAQGIEMLPKKGMMLSLRLSGDPAMRSARDLDLLARPEKLDAGDRILRDEGSRRTFPDFELAPKRQTWVLQQSHHFAYYRDDRRQLIELELHWRLLQRRVEHVAELWNHCQPTSWMGSSFLNLNDDAFPLFLCDHGAKHRWNRLKWLSDGAALLAQERSFSWENILALADRFDLSLVLVQAGLLGYWLYGVPLPLAGLVANEKRSGSLAAQAVDAVLLSETGQFALPVRLKNAVYPIRIRERLPGHVSLRNCLLSTDEFKVCPLPDSLFWLYFPLRPLLWCYHHYIKRVT